MKCANCGSELPDWKFFCDNCGASVEDGMSSSDDSDDFDDYHEHGGFGNFKEFQPGKKSGKQIGLSKPVTGGPAEAPDRHKKAVIILSVILGVVSVLLIAALIILILLYRFYRENADLIDSADAYFEDAGEYDPFATDEADVFESTSMQSGDYPANVASLFAEATETVSSTANALLSEMDGSYESYEHSKSVMQDFYASSLSASESLYSRLEEQNANAYRQIAERINDPSFDCNTEMDAIYNTWDPAMNQYYETWDNLYSQLFEKWDSALSAADADSTDDSNEWSMANDAHQNAWDAIYNAHQNAWGRMYDAHFAVLNGFLSGDTDVDRLINEAYNSSSSQQNEVPDTPPMDENDAPGAGKRIPEGEDAAGPDKKPDESDEDASADNEGEEETSEDAGFDAVDTSNATIEAMQTYGDYLTLCEMVINEYLADYEAALLNAGLYDDADYQNIRNEMENLLNEEQNAYGSKRDEKISGREALIDYLEDLRDMFDRDVKNVENSANM
ncbi:MAG: hypothetical protein K6E16_12150 [Lachnospiraceae bacterium]|nr:hypothetical protein [Lachnospiraceae bacterium]